MNSFDTVVILALAVAVGTGFRTGLLRSAATILAYLIAMPLALMVISYVQPLEEHGSSLLGHNAGLFLLAFLIIGMALGKLARMMVDDVIGPELGTADRLAGAALGALRVAMVAISIGVVFDRMIPPGSEPSFLKGSQLRPLLSAAAQHGLQALPPEVAAAIDRLKRRT